MCLLESLPPSGLEVQPAAIHLVMVLQLGPQQLKPQHPSPSQTQYSWNDYICIQLTLCA